MILRSLKSLSKTSLKTKENNSDLLNLQKESTFLREDRIKELQNWLFQRAADRLTFVKTNDEKVKWIKFACMIESIGKK